MTDRDALPVRRAFADLADAQVHYRRAGPTPTAGDRTPLVMLHASPGSSKQLEPLIGALGAGRPVLAPDMPGNGDSTPLPLAVPEIADLAAHTLAFMDAAGLDRVDLHGSHTGARIATELALTRPGRVRRVILDGFGVYTPDQREEILATYAPEQEIDPLGRHLLWAWHFARDQWIWFPWFKKQDAARVTLDLPPPRFLHDLTLEILKGTETYHRTYRAAFRYDMTDAVPRLTCPTLIAFQRTDMIFPMLNAAAALLPGAETAALPGTATPGATAETAAIMARFLDAP